MVAEILEQPNKRKLVTIRTVSAVLPIEGADAIEVVQVDGWKVVVKKGEFSPSDKCLYFEIDSFLPDGVEAWQFLVDKQPKIFNGVKGHKLRTIKLRGAISQGLVLRPEQVLDIVERNGQKFINTSNYQVTRAENGHLQDREPDQR